MVNTLSADGHGALPRLSAASPQTDAASWIIAAAAFMLIAFRQTYVVPALPLSLSPARLLLFAAGGAFIIACLLGQKDGCRLGVLGPVMAIYLISTLTAYGVGMRSETMPIRTTDYYVVVELLLIVAVVYCFNVIRSYGALSRIIKALVAGGLVSALFAIVAHLTGADLAAVLRLPGLVEKDAILNRELVRADVVRPQGSAGHPLELAAVLTIIFPLAVGVTFSMRAVGRQWKPWALASAIILVGVVVSVSRAALIGLSVAFVLMALYWPIRRSLLIIAGIAGAATSAFVVSPSLFNAYSSTLGLGMGDPSAQYRLAAAQYILSHLSAFGSFGRGGGSDNYIFDNQYLYRLSETGVFGLLAYVLLLGTAWVLAHRAFLNARRSMNPLLPAAALHLFLGLSASIAAYAIMNIVLDVGGFVQIWTTMWLLLGASAVAYRISRTPRGRDQLRTV